MEKGGTRPVVLMPVELLSSTAAVGPETPQSGSPTANIHSCTRHHGPTLAHLPASRSTAVAKGRLVLQGVGVCGGSHSSNGCALSHT